MEGGPRVLGTRHVGRGRERGVEHLGEADGTLEQGAEMVRELRRCS
jgi:hypothetical protein